MCDACLVVLRSGPKVDRVADSGKFVLLSGTRAVAGNVDNNCALISEILKGIIRAKCVVVGMYAIPLRVEALHPGDLTLSAVFPFDGQVRVVGSLLRPCLHGLTKILK